MVFRLPVAFRLPAFASWSSFARWGAGPSLRLAYRPCCQGRTPTGLSRFARMRCGRGGCPLYPGDCGALTAGRSSPAATCRFPAASPWTPVRRPITGASSNEASPRVHGRSPVRPSPRLWPPDGTAALGLLPRAPHAAVAGDACRGGDRHWALAWATSPSTWPSFLRSHSPRAPSWRTSP